MVQVFGIGLCGLLWRSAGRLSGIITQAPNRVQIGPDRPILLRLMYDLVVHSLFQDFGIIEIEALLFCK